jgi:hypothetical protein
MKPFATGGLMVALRIMMLLDTALFQHRHAEEGNLNTRVSEMPPGKSTGQIRSC